jgi:hypothetical protein
MPPPEQPENNDSEQKRDEMRDNGYGLNDAQRTELKFIAAKQKEDPMHVWRS